MVCIGHLCPDCKRYWKWNTPNDNTCQGQPVSGCGCRYGKAEYVIYYDDFEWWVMQTRKEQLNNGKQ